jgi:hypothetical protein
MTDVSVEMGAIDDLKNMAKKTFLGLRAAYCVCVLEKGSFWDHKRTLFTVMANRFTVKR